MKPRRYQLRKEAGAINERGHPWLFREQMSSAAQVFGDGQWLRLVDGQNKVVGHGIYESEGAIAIRVLRRGEQGPDAAWLRGAVEDALAKRRELAKRTDGIRLLHGESDGIPAVVADRFGKTIVVSSYSAGAEAIARYVAKLLASCAEHELRLLVGAASHILLRPARRRRGPPLPARVLRGEPAELAFFEEEGLRYAVDLAEGHKTGTYLDLPALRRALATSPLTGARVLNLFAYTGMLGRAAEAAGAASITHVDQSQRALDFAAAHHVTDPARHTFVAADIFRWLPALDPAEQYDVIIVDPPAMTSRASQVPNVLAAYRKLYRAAEAHVRPGGLLVSACCTSRVPRDVFRKRVRGALPERFTLERDLPPEPDHPVGFAQADYLKILLWRASA